MFRENFLKKILDQKKIDEAVSGCKYLPFLQSLNIPYFIIEYKKGESIVTPYMKERYFQIVLDGSLSIYFIRNDGSQYGLSSGGKDSILGDMELFIPEKESIFVTAETPLKAVTIDEEKWGEQLLNNVDFLRLISGEMASKISAITNSDAIPCSLSERVLNYIQYKCNGKLKGVEKAAMYLHCSSRQLQRILNDFEAQGQLEKVGKGEYQLIFSPISS